MRLDEQAIGYEDDVEGIPIEDVVFDQHEYATRRMPVSYPLGGFRAWLRIGLECNLWYMGVAPPRRDQDESGSVLRAEIRQLGSGKHVEYTLRVWEGGDGQIVVDFCDVVGYGRWLKLQYLLKALGIPSERIVRHWPAQGDLYSLEDAAVASDLEKASAREVDAVFVGGLSSAALSELGDGVRAIAEGGELAIRWRIVEWRDRRLLLTSYPYSTLAEFVGRRASQIASSLLFVGSAGALTPDLARGDIYIPGVVYSSQGWFGEMKNEAARVAKHPTGAHLTVRTPLEETGQLVSKAYREKWLTVDCELAWLLKGYAPSDGNRRVASAVFITDEAWRSKKGITHLSYRDRHIRSAACLAAKCVLETVLNVPPLQARRRKTGKT